METIIENSESKTTRALEPGELASFVDIETRRGKLFSDLGAITHQVRALEQQRNEIHSELDQVDREYRMFSNRMTQKYGLKPNTPIDLVTGAITE